MSCTRAKISGKSGEGPNGWLQSKRRYKRQGPQRFRSRRPSRLAHAPSHRHFLTARLPFVTRRSLVFFLLCRGQPLFLPPQLSFPHRSSLRYPRSRHLWLRLSDPSPTSFNISLRYRVYPRSRSVAHSPLTSFLPYLQPSPLLLAFLSPNSCGTQSFPKQNKHRLLRRRYSGCLANLTKDAKVSSPSRPLVSVCPILHVPSYSRPFQRSSAIPNL